MKRSICSLIVLFAAVTISCEKVATDEAAINQLYRDFEQGVSEKNIGLVESVFLAPDTRLYAYVRSVEGLNNAAYSLSKWTTVLGSISDPHRIELSNINIQPYGRIAYSTADYEEFHNDKTKSTGKDLFIYLKTEAGWKIASLSHTATIQNDSINKYAFEPGRPGYLKMTMDQFFMELNSKDSADIKLAFKGDDPFLLPEKEPITLRQLCEDVSGTWELKEADFNVVDNNLAIGVMTVDVTKNQLIESKTCLASFYSESKQEWLITSFVCD